MIITCVVNDIALSDSDLRTEHGLTFWMDTGDGVMLLDTGESGDVLIHNMNILGLDPGKIQTLAISHAHSDHTGGLKVLVNHITPGLPLFANSDLFRPRFSERDGNFKIVGLPVDKKWLHKFFTLRLSDSPQQIMPGVWTTGEITKHPHPLGSSKHHYVKKSEEYIPDPYKDDLSLVIELGTELMLLCGCCHAGLLNTMEHVQRTFNRPIVIIAGGTHLGSADSSTLDAISQKIKTEGIVRRIYLNHCSGKRAYNTLRDNLGDNLVLPCPAGTVIDVEDILLQ